MPTTKIPTLLTTKQAAELMSVKPAGMRSLARFARERGIELLAPTDEWPDLRTPMYDSKKLIHYRDVQRPNRDWPLSLEEQRKLKAERAAALEAKRAAAGK